MPNEYQIDGSVTLRACPESTEIIQELRLVFDFHGAIKMEKMANEITLSLTGSSSRSYVVEEMPGLLERMEPVVIGVGFFDCESEGDRWVEYVGDPDECHKLASAEALLDINSLLPKLCASDRQALIENIDLQAQLSEARGEERHPQRSRQDRQVDLRARVRDAKTELVQEGLLVLRGWNKFDREEAARRGHVIDDEQCICLNLVPSGKGA